MAKAPDTQPAEELPGTQDETSEPELAAAPSPDLGQTPEGKDMLDNFFEEGFTKEQDEAMNFDPFSTPEAKADEAGDGAPKKEEDSPPDEVIRGTDDKTKEEKEEAKTEPAGDKDKPADQVDPRDQELALLKQANQQIQSEITAMRAQVQQPAPAAAQPAQAQAPAATAEQPQLPNHMVQMPNELMTLLNSEDLSERSTGFSHLSKGIADMVYSTVMQDVEKRITSASENVETRVTERQATVEETQRVTVDFYSKFPSLDTPALKSFVGEVTRQIITETGARVWTPELRDAVGLRATNLIKAAASTQGGNGAGESPLTPGAPAPKPPTVIKGGARPQAQNPDSVEAFISETLFKG